MDSNWQVSEIYEPEVPAASQSEKTKLTLKEQSAEDCPLEKLAAFGAENLSTAELLAIIIGGGTPKETAVDLTKRMLHDCKDSLNLLGKMSLTQLKRYDGIGDAKAISIIAACELGRRRQREDVFKREVLDTPQLIYEHLYPQICDLGLIYRIELNEDGTLELDLTFTAPSCPAADFILEDVRTKVEAVSGVKSATVNMVFEPEWDKSMMTEEARVELGFD